MLGSMVVVRRNSHGADTAAGARKMIQRQRRSGGGDGGRHNSLVFQQLVCTFVSLDNTHLVRLRLQDDIVMSIYKMFIHHVGRKIKKTVNSIAQIDKLDIHKSKYIKKDSNAEQYYIITTSPVHTTTCQSKSRS